jgi:Bacterial Ig-like domain
LFIWKFNVNLFQGKKMNFSKIGRYTQQLNSFAVVAGLVLGLSGCFDTKEDTTTPLSTGTIQGKLIDSFTLQPVVGASVNIGGTVASTNTEGQYVLSNIQIPLDATNNIKAATYRVTVDLRNVTSPLNMAGATAPQRYPDFSYDLISLSFANANSSTSTTPVNYLLSNVDFRVGKQAAKINGIVADKNTRLPVAGGYTVKLFALGSSGGSGNESLAGSTLTDAYGAFTFANIETLRNFRIDSWNQDQTFRGSQTVTAPAEGITRTLSVQTNDAVLVASTDTLAPTIISVTPQMDSDIAPAPVDVVFTFSEPILQTADTSTSPSVVTGLYNKVDVKFMGAKASNIARSLAWNSTFTQLTISIPSLAASSKYTVDLTPANALLVDLNGNALNNTTDKRVLNFTTNGSTTPVAPALITLANNSSLNYNSPTVLLNWLPVSGAKAYNVYRAQNFPGAAGQLQLVGSNPSTLTSDFSDTLPAGSFVSGQNNLTYTYVVKSVSADNIESAASPAVTAQDNVAPTATIQPGLAASYIITFSEPVDEVSAVTLSNYVLVQGVAGSVPVVSGAVLNAGLSTVTLTLSENTATGNILTITGVKDIAGNTMTGASRTF